MRTLGPAIVAMIAIASFAAYARTGDSVRRIVEEQILGMLPADGAGGIAVAVRIDGRVLFFAGGYADLAERRPVTPDSLFNIASLRKPFEATLLADAVRRGDMALDDPVWKHVPELSAGGDVRRITVGQLASHTSGLLLPQDHPPWPTERYSLAGFLDTLNAWKVEPHHQPGRQHMYTHAGFILLQLTLERALGAPIADLARTRIFEPLGMASSAIPLRGEDGRGALPSFLMQRAVQGYGEDGAIVGQPGDQQTYYLWPGTGQMYASARDLAVFLAANMGEGCVPPRLAAAMRLAQVPAVPTGPHSAQALAWETDDSFGPLLIDKNGGLNNASAYMGMMPAQRLGIVVLSNRGGIDVAQAGRRALHQLARHGW